MFLTLDLKPAQNLASHKTFSESSASSRVKLELVQNTIYAKNMISLLTLNRRLIGKDKQHTGKPYSKSTRHLLKLCQSEERKNIIQQF